MTISQLPTYSFGDTPEQQDHLAELIVRGIKTATCSALADCNPHTLPKVGDCFTVVNSRGEAQCIIQITEMTIKRFDQVDAAFAYNEGEDDRSLESWRKEHERFFRAQNTFQPDMKLICERFKIVS